MGFDLYGLKPNLKTKRPEIDWSQKLTQEEKQTYFKDLERFEEENPGYYFRNNIWMWHPLADFTLSLTNGLFTESEKKRWHHNDRFRVEDMKAKVVADKLNEAYGDGRVKEHKNKMDIIIKEASEYNEVISKQLKELREIVIKKTKKENIVPADYPEPFREQYNSTQALWDYRSSYPFYEENVEDFIKFCYASGGFDIC